VIDVEEPIHYKPVRKSVNDVDIIKQFYKLLDDCESKYVDHYFQRNKDLYRSARSFFSNGELDIQQWALIEELYYAVSKKCLELVDDNNDDLLNRLRDKLADKYFCNFSLFQTMPDSWAIDQIFPILPLQRLNERPDRRCTIQDLTCDSDGRIDSYVDSEGIETSLPIHSLQDKEPYLVGIFLLGAYQEILGDIHNLFGDTASVNVELDSENNIQLNEIDFGDKVSDLFQAIHIDTEKLQQRYNMLVGQSALDNKVKAEYLALFVNGLDGYTYLED
jgi:arginine decarboxylase